MSRLLLYGSNLTPAFIPTPIVITMTLVAPTFTLGPPPISKTGSWEPTVVKTGTWTDVIEKTVNL